MTSGRVVLAATPIGNPGDASARLRDLLASADVVAAEDTRRLRGLATALGVTIRGRVMSFYEHNEAGRVPQLIDRVRAGDVVAVVTDAGMPAVSDPGYSLVTACIDADLPVTCLPGPSAVTTALVLSGLPVDRFCFDGFPPRRAGRRRTWLARLVAEERTCVFFESPHRLAETLAEAAEALGPGRRAAVCRELTKTYEEVLRGTLGDLADRTADGVRGEIVVVIEGADAPGSAATTEDLVEIVEERVEAGERLKDACATVAEGSSLTRRELYQAVVDARG
ncbi:MULTISPECIES: 16S rRNA (cytidine(1402)-2'-O)-methyltransferase [unclassified Dietzia]|uniref:16S rRNA (cytidine(1402)-2'-O)-methyltransferase n=1 Tax=unclassified Dietzia TaxID=2617939 RepID=UPI0015F8E331|nr:MULTISPECIES: 16S rRNA (cytidine(1402)-2'-O)-methyltransferase [unclassified Dietzia]MBB1024788.1 16S rRNA (cytidine(1402)-2'-O)-methyltransferase [Dietzia sp. DQ12-76]MBB1026630.1 16S rRNA (cytidine(1402)-2'-O)-methyltransferase [Dietzia sp. DQ11-38-2]